MSATIIDTITTTTMVVSDTTSNTDIICTFGSQLAGAIVGKIEKNGCNTGNGLPPLDVIDTIVLTLKDALPFLLIQTTTEDQLLAWPMHGILSLEH